MKYLKYLFLLSIILIDTNLQAQTRENPFELEQKRIHDLFYNTDIIKTTKDSTRTYTFAFKAVVEKDGTGKTHVISLTANDSIAYKIYPNYKFLETVNYKLFMKDKKQAVFIFPVALQVIGTEPDSYYDNKRLLNYFIDNALRRNFLEKVMSLFSIKPLEQASIENKIYFDPFLLWLDKSIKN
jgi:hypothetical protein